MVGESHFLQTAPGKREPTLTHLVSLHVVGDCVPSNSPSEQGDEMKAGLFRVRGKRVRGECGMRRLVWSARGELGVREENIKREICIHSGRGECRDEM